MKTYFMKHIKIRDKNHDTEIHRNLARPGKKIEVSDYNLGAKVCKNSKPPEPQKMGAPVPPIRLSPKFSQNHTACLQLNDMDCPHCDI